MAGVNTPMGTSTVHCGLVSPPSPNGMHSFATQRESSSHSSSLAHPLGVGMHVSNLHAKPAAQQSAAHTTSPSAASHSSGSHSPSLARQSSVTTSHTNGSTRQSPMHKP